MRWLRYALIAGCLLVAPQAQAAFELGDIICETTATTGTGTINLGGAVSNYATFVSQITTGATVPYNIVSGDGKIETGIGTFTDATPDTLSRTANWSTDGSGAELTLSGTSRACLGPIEQIWNGGVLTPWFLAIEMGSSATDTTLSRGGAGLLAVEGVTVPTGSPDVQTMTATGSGDSWDKPTGGQRMCQVEIWGGGGSGGKGAAAAAAGGGGGGAYDRKLWRIADLGATETVSIATGGTSQTSASTDGNVGGNTTFGSAGTLMTAYGGGGGDLGATGGGGGGGGGSRAAGGAGATITGGATEGTIVGTVGNLNAGPYGSPGGNGVATGNAITPVATAFGGAGGGGTTGDATGTNAPGGASDYGGGGGGAGAEDAAPGPGAGGDSVFGGDGGAGAFDASNATGGTQPGGGGGGSETGNSGAGGNGKAVITCW